MMTELVEILGIPFLACVVMSVILGYFGHHVIKREIIFVDIALAQAAAMGSIIAHVAFGQHEDSFAGDLCSFGCVLVLALFYSWARRAVSQICLEAVIGISYAVVTAAAMLLVGLSAGGHIHIQELLAGSLLWIDGGDVLRSFLVFSAVGVCLFFTRKRMACVTRSYQKGEGQSACHFAWDFLFYALLGLVITVSVRMAGVVVVFSYLIVPATSSIVLSRRPSVQWVLTWGVSLIGSIGGLVFCYRLDFSVGPSIALFLGGVLVLAVIFKKIQLRVNY